MAFLSYGTLLLHVTTVGLLTVCVLQINDDDDAFLARAMASLTYDQLIISVT